MKSMTKGRKPAHSWMSRIPLPPAILFFPDIIVVTKPLSKPYPIPPKSHCRNLPPSYQNHSHPRCKRVAFQRPLSLTTEYNVSTTLIEPQLCMFTCCYLSLRYRIDFQ